MQAQITDSLKNNPSEDVSPEAESTAEIPAWKRVSLVHDLDHYQTVADSLVFSPDSKLLLSGGASNDSYITFWSVKKGQELDYTRAQRTAVLAMAISPDGKTLLSGGEDAGLNVWDWRTGEYQATFLEHSKSITSLAISPDSKILITGGLDGLKVWDLAYSPQRPTYTLANMGTLTNVVAMNPNGYIVASGNDRGKVLFWNLQTGTKISDFMPHSDMVTGLAFSPDGKTLITASYDRTIKIWDLQSGQLLNTLTGHKDLIRAIALHPDGNVLASAGNDGIILWDLTNAQELTKIKKHRNWVQSLAFSPDGQYLASGGYDFTVKIWQSLTPSTNE
ncbi:MAG: WD40 repeat domain-containing protein [Pleurocapsa sp.]